MRVLKFGGTSMGDEHTWRKVLDIIKKYEQPIVIVSATARTTRQLLAAAEQALEDPQKALGIAEDIRNRHKELTNNFLANFPDTDSKISKDCHSWIDQKIGFLKTTLEQVNEQQELTLQTKDTVAAIGEQLSSYLLVNCGRAYGLSSQWIDATKLIRTNSDFGQATPDTNFINEQAQSILVNISEATIPIMGGYYGQDQHGNTTTLGFEGSDYTASLVGAALFAEAIEIWTDVSGIYTCDPRVVSNARPIPELSFQQATELAYFGAKVLNPSTTKPASQKQIPVWVKNIFEPDQPGTRISHETHDDGRVKAMTFKENCVVITVTSLNTVMGYEFLAGVFDILRWHHLPVDVVTTTEASVSIAIEKSKRITDAVEQLKSYGNVTLEHNQGIISLVGCTTMNIQLLVTDVLDDINSSLINMISFSQSKGNLNIVMDKPHIVPSVKSIHQHIFS